MSIGGLGGIARQNASLVGGAVFVAATIGFVSLGGDRTVAVFALSFWHYYLYWLAYRFGAVPPAVFRRDAIAMKTVSLVALGTAYFAAPLDAASLAVVAAGFLLNGMAAAALGADRTYYGYEVAGLPRRQVTVFPYSVIAHPMLVGNMAAFSGTLLNADFRAHWWALGCAHVALNLALLVMETRVTPQRRGSGGAATRTRASGLGPCSPAVAFGAVAIGAAAGGAAGSAWRASVPLWALLGACTLAYVHLLYCRYSMPGSPRHQPRAQTESLS